MVCAVAAPFLPTTLSVPPPRVRALVAATSLVAVVMLPKSRVRVPLFTMVPPV